MRSSGCLTAFQSGSPSSIRCPFRVIASRNTRFKNGLRTVDHLTTLVDLLLQFRQRHRQPAVMTLFGEEFIAWNYPELADRATNIARKLVSAGVGHEDPIAILAPNSAERIAAYFGIVAAGATAVPLDSHLSPRSESFSLPSSLAAVKKSSTAVTRLLNLSARSS